MEDDGRTVAVGPLMTAALSPIRRRAVSSRTLGALAVAGVASDQGLVADLLGRQPQADGLVHALDAVRGELGRQAGARGTRPAR